jgi:hypothetical protein
MSSEAPQPFDPGEWLHRFQEAGSNVKFGSGIVAKTNRAVLAVLGLWGVIAWKLGPSWIGNAALICVGIAATAFVVWWAKATHSFAERNPAQAVLDGAQFVAYKRFEAEWKGLPAPAPSPVIENPRQPPAPDKPEVDDVGS